MKVNKFYFIVGALVMGALFGYIFLKISNPSTAQSIISGNGRIEATEINISSKTAGQLEDVLVKEGQFVESGQVLAKIKVLTLEAKLREANAQLRQAEDAVINAEAQVMMRMSERDVAKAMVEQRQTELSVIQKRLTRSEMLAQDGAVSKQQLDDERAGLQSAIAVLTSAQSQVRSAESAIIAAHSQVSSAKSQVEAVKATIDSLSYDIEDAQLKAPLNARVQFQTAQIGEMINTGGRVMNLIDLSDVYMTFFLPETMAGRISIGSEVRIVLDAKKNRVIPAKVSFIADRAQFTPKSVETENERQKLMFRIRANIDPKLLEKYIHKVKTGLPGMAKSLVRNSVTNILM